MITMPRTRNTARSSTEGAGNSFVSSPRENSATYPSRNRLIKVAMPIFERSKTREKIRNTAQTIM